MKFKKGVKLDGIKGPALQILIEAEPIWEAYGSELVVTSGLDSHANRPRSLHNQGLAVDLRIWHLKDPAAAANKLADALGDSYDVILEKDHIHAEFDV